MVKSAFGDPAPSRAHLRFQRFRDDLAYNLVTLRKPVGIVLSLLFMAMTVLKTPLQAHQQPDAVEPLAENKSPLTAQMLNMLWLFDMRDTAAIALERAIASGVGRQSRVFAPLR